MVFSPDPEHQALQTVSTQSISAEFVFPSSLGPRPCARHQSHHRSERDPPPSPTPKLIICVIDEKSGK